MIFWDLWTAFAQRSSHVYVIDRSNQIESYRQHLHHNENEFVCECELSLSNSPQSLDITGTERRSWRRSKPSDHPSQFRLFLRFKCRACLPCAWPAYLCGDTNCCSAHIRSVSARRTRTAGGVVECATACTIGRTAGTRRDSRTGWSQWYWRRRCTWNLCRKQIDGANVRLLLKHKYQYLYFNLCIL